MDLVYEPTERQVARALLRAGAYLIRPEQFFQWKSGICAPVYTDCRILARNPGGNAICVRALASSIRTSFPLAQYVIGMAEAGIMWSAQTAYELALPHAFVRKMKKGHGSQARVECSPECGAMAVLVDDLVGSGETLEKAIIVLLEERRIEVIGIQSIVNWNFKVARERFDRIGVPVRALVSYPQVLRAALEVGKLSTAAVSELTNFYQNPTEHAWNLDVFLSTSAGASKCMDGGIRKGPQIF